MTAEDGADHALPGGEVAHTPAELPAGPLPRDPGDGAAPDLLDQRRSVDGTGEGDDRVGVEMVDVGVLDEAVHGRVDRRGGAAGPVAAVGEQPDHLVLVLDPSVDAVEGHQAVAFEDGETGRGEGAEVAARALDVEQLDRLAAGRVGDGHLG